MTKPQICVWDFDPDEFVAWKAFTGFTFETYEDYKHQLDSMIDSMSDHEVIRFGMTVEEMSESLMASDLDNTTENRAAILAQQGGRDD